MSEGDRARGVFQRPFDALASVVVPVVADAVDPDDLIERIDVNELLDRIDVNALIDRIDVNELIDRIDLDAVLDRVDLDRLLARLDLDAVVDRVDVDRVAARLDVDAVADCVDVERVVARVDVDAIAESLDIDAIVAKSTKGVSNRFIDLFRRQIVGLDEISMRTVSRLLRRDYASLPAGPPMTVELDSELEPLHTMSGRYAGPVSRLGALALDVFLISATFTLLLAGVQYLLDVFFETAPEFTSSGGLLALVGLVAYGFFYFWISQAVTGRTPSQALVGLKVVRSDGSPLSPGAAAIRTVVLPFSFVLFGIGALMMLVDRRRRALQDVAARSAVVYDWGDRPAALPAPLTRFLDDRAVPVSDEMSRRSPRVES